jgi:hypothetical protein
MAEKLFTEMNALLTHTLTKVDWVASTADGWSSPNRKKFVGETIHWFDQNLKRVIGPSTYYTLFDGYLNQTTTGM